MRWEEKLLCNKTKAAQLTQRSKEMLETIVLNLILFCVLACSFLIYEYLNPEEIGECRNVQRCQYLTSLHIYFIIYNLLCLIICMMCSHLRWSKLSEYRSKWAQEWKNNLKTEQYETIVTSVFRNYILGRTKRSDLILFHKEILKREEEFRLKELGRIRKVRVFTVFNILYVTTLLALGQY